MGLTDQAIEDFQAISSNDADFGISITMTAPTLETATLNGFHTKHHYALNEQGQEVNSKKASICFSEISLLSANPDYPIRITDATSPMYGEVSLKDHLVIAPDSTGVVKNYIVRSWFPDEKIGAIVIILEDYAA